MKHFTRISLVAAMAITTLQGCVKEEEPIIIIERSSVTDVEANTYATVKIGDQWWMAENLRTTLFNDNTPIQYFARTVGADTNWTNATFPAYSYINDSISGCLYNSYVIASEKNIAPVGWHVPTDADWKKLEQTIGMSASESHKTGWRGDEEADLITSQYNVGWGANDTENGLYGSDLYGFNARPGGCRGVDGRTNIQSNSAFWWADTMEGTEWYYRNIEASHKRIFRQRIHSLYGLSIRCVKD
ncbi:MAG: fibrobacter succinogenes major paralogous domain-containing protein [Flavobacteriales bacterium]